MGMPGYDMNVTGRWKIVVLNDTGFQLSGYFFVLWQDEYGEMDAHMWESFSGCGSI